LRSCGGDGASSWSGSGGRADGSLDCILRGGRGGLRSRSGDWASSLSDGTLLYRSGGSGRVTKEPFCDKEVGLISSHDCGLEIVEGDAEAARRDGTELCAAEFGLKTACIAVKEEAGRLRPLVAALKGVVELYHESQLIGGVLRGRHGNGSRLKM